MTMKSLNKGCSVRLQDINIVRHFLVSSGNFPNNGLLALLIYESVLDETDPDRIKHVLENNGWVNAWVNGVYDYHHYHSTAHEVLCVLKGFAQLQFGGPEGITAHVKDRDVIIIPAGVAHKCLNAGDGFEVLGAYPEGQHYDIKKGTESEKDEAEQNIKAVPLPLADPVYGIDGPLLKTWMKITSQ
jgi:uncharacterized protein YjlB